MLARKHKLSPAALFDRRHRTVRSEHLVVTYAPTRGAKKTTGACAVVVSAKVARTAVLRHAIKRALFDEFAASRPVSFDAVISVKKIPVASTAPSKKTISNILRTDFKKLLTHLRS